jgi:hypothetical protein
MKGSGDAAWLLCMLGFVNFSIMRFHIKRCSGSAVHCLKMRWQALALQLQA